MTMPHRTHAESGLFQPIEQLVIRLARRERGSGCIPERGIAARLNAVLVALALVKRVPPLADPRLELLRCFINRAHNRRTRPKDVDALVDAGYTGAQIEAVMHG